MTLYEQPRFFNFLFSRGTILGVIVVLLLTLSSYVFVNQAEGWATIFGVVESGLIGASVFLTLLTIPLYSLGIRRMFGLRVGRPLSIVLDSIICSILSIYINQFTTSIQSRLDGTPIWLRLLFEALYLVVIIIPVLRTIGAKHYQEEGAQYFMSKG